VLLLNQVPGVREFVCGMTNGLRQSGCKLDTHPGPHNRTDALPGDVAEHVMSVHVSEHAEANGHGRMQVSAGQLA
jgi:hypothetical protein